MRCVAEIIGGALGKWDILDDTRFALPGVSRSRWDKALENCCREDL